MDFFVHMYYYDWGSGTGADLSAKVNWWLDQFDDCGFTGVAITEDLHVYDITAEEWHFVVTTPLTQDPDDTILNRLQGYNRPKSYNILFRQWTDVPDRQYGVQTGTAFREFIQSEFGANVIGPIYVNYRSILNAYEPKAADVIKFMADGVVESGIYDACVGVLVGWDLSNEADDVRQFQAPPLPQLQLPVRTGERVFVDRSSAGVAQRAPSGTRTVRIHDANIAMAVMGGAARQIYGSSKPIGLLRGSCWDFQAVRRTLPFAPWETAVQTNDVNQVPNGRCQNAGFTQTPVQEEALMFACDILRGSGAELMVAEADRLGDNMNIMVPPDIRVPPGTGDEEGFQNAIYNRAVICFERGVSFTVAHWAVGTGVNRLPAWEQTFQSIASVATTPPVDLGPTIAASPDDIPAAVAAWKAAGGGPGLMVPVRFR